MAKKAKQKAKNKHEKSYANAVGGVKTPSVFAKTTCVLKMPPTYPNRRIPTTKEKNSLFLDLRATDATDIEVAEALEKMQNICGVNYRDDLRSIEVIFINEESRNDYARRELVIEGKKNLFPMLPREQQPNILYIRLANLPYGNEEEIRREICGHWEEYGEILDVAPHKVYNKWLTRRWDLLLVIPNGMKLEAPVAFNILDRPVVAAWPASPPSCLVCNSAGHQARKCPRKNPKAGGTSDPENKVGQASRSIPSQKQPTPVVQGTTEKTVGTSETQSEEKAKSPEDLQSGGTTAEMIGIEESPASEVADHMSEDGENEETVVRTITPPAQMIETVEEKNTPRKDKKRMSKTEYESVIPPREDIKNPMVRKYMIENYLCGRCGEDHRGKKCTVSRSGVLDIVLDRWNKEKEEKKIEALKGPMYQRLRSKTAVASSSKSAQGETEAFVDIPQWCTKCQKGGHVNADCRRANCNHCGSKQHIGAFCPQRAKYAFEKK
jgi:hypothetical protein